MGLALMADDVDRLLGKLEGVFSELSKRVDGAFEQLTARLDRQDTNDQIRDQIREKDKAQAIENRERDKAEIAAKIERMERKATDTFGLASMNAVRLDGHDKAIADHGATLDGHEKRLTDIEKSRAESAAESRGKKIAYGTVGAAGGAAFTAFGADIADFVRRLFHGG